MTTKRRTVDDILAAIPTRAMVHPGQESRVDRALRTLDPDHAAALRKVLDDEANEIGVKVSCEALTAPPAPKVTTP